MAFKNIKTNSLFGADLKWLDNLFRNLSADAQEDFFPGINVLFCHLKRNRIQIAAVRTLGSGHLHTVMLLHSVSWMCETGCCTAIWNVQEAGATGTKLVRVRVTCHSVRITRLQDAHTGSQNVYRVLYTTYMFGSMTHTHTHTHTGASVV